MGVTVPFPGAVAAGGAEPFTYQFMTEVTPLDKYEYKIRAEEIKTLISQKKYAEAAKVADTIDWTRVKSVMMLCTVSDVYKQKVLAAKDISTMVTGRRLGHPVRAIKNTYMNAYAKLEADSNVPDEELEKFGVGSLRKAAREGNAEEGCFLAGQIAGMVKKEQPAKEIIDEVMAQAEQTMEGVKWNI